MTAHGKSGALTTGFILIAFGVIFLVENFYAPFSAWRLIARYWPVIIIIIGLRKLFDYFYSPKNQSSDPIPPKE